MILKQYQKRVSDTLDVYLKKLQEYSEGYNTLLRAGNNTRGYHFPKYAFIDVTNKQSYTEITNRIGNPVPSICLKIPTGGGKTLQVCHAIPEIQRQYYLNRNGLVLWIVPSQQIYAQTLNALKDRNHPYKRVLDIGSGNPTIIKEKTDNISIEEVENNLVILLLMLPSASRSKNEYLKVFRDSGRYTSFFPEDDNYKEHRELIDKIPNLDVFENQLSPTQKQIKSSLGNLIRSQKPLVILDEGHKTYSLQARETLYDLNPTFILELSATPSEKSNILVNVSGKELHKEEMIKLPIHLSVNNNDSWKDTLRKSKCKIEELDDDANKLYSESGVYIRPICLIQVERTGNSSSKGEIHAEDVKEHLINTLNIPSEYVAIKSSSVNDIEGLDLLSKECEIRYIITHKALQEGWDCPFAYVLCILNNSKSKTSVTQLLGRILRQPYATRTNLTTLNECYVYTNRSNSQNLLNDIKKSLENEGLGDLYHHIVDTSIASRTLSVKNVGYRTKMKKFCGKIYLPKFIVPEKNGCRDLNYEVDILSRIPWDDIKIDNFNINYNNHIAQETQEITINLSGNIKEVIQSDVVKVKSEPSQFDIDYVVRRLCDVIPNPWVAYEISKKIINKLLTENSEEVISNNLTFTVEQILKYLTDERNRLAKEVFCSMLEDGKLLFFLCKYNGYSLPTKIQVEKSSEKYLHRNFGEPLQKSLFDEVPEDELNDSEKDVALYLDNQQQLLWWYRNRSKQDFYIQGWRENKIYPDFIAAKSKYSDEKEIETVYVIETKGPHLYGSEDSLYKMDVFELCDKIATRTVWNQISNNFPNETFKFQVINLEDWRNTLNGMLA